MSLLSEYDLTNFDYQDMRKVVVQALRAISPECVLSLIPPAIRKIECMRVLFSLLIDEQIVQRLEKGVGTLDQDNDKRRRKKLTFYSNDLTTAIKTF